MHNRRTAKEGGSMSLDHGVHRGFLGLDDPDHHDPSSNDPRYDSTGETMVRPRAAGKVVESDVVLDAAEIRLKPQEPD